MKNLLHCIFQVEQLLRVNMKMSFDGVEKKFHFRFDISTTMIDVFVAQETMKNFSWR